MNLYKLNFEKENVKKMFTCGCSFFLSSNSVIEDGLTQLGSINVLCASIIAS